MLLAKNNDFLYIQADICFHYFKMPVKMSLCIVWSVILLIALIPF